MTEAQNRAHLSYLVAASVDGRIAHSDGTWSGMLEEGAHVAAFLAMLGEFDTVLMGRRTYEVGLEHGLESGEPAYPGLEHFVFSRSLTLPDGSPMRVVTDSPPAFVAELKRSSERRMWLCGGGEIAGQLLGAGLIDELHVKLNPTLFGDGVPLAAALGRRVDLTLRETRVFESGVVFLRYGVRATESSDGG